MDNKKYKVVFTEDTGDDYGVVDTEEFASDSYDEIKQYFIKNKEKEKSYYTNGYGNKRDKYYTIYDSNNKNITEQLKKDIEKSDIKKESNKELNKNNNSEQLSDGFYIKITPSQNFDPEFKKLFDESSKNKDFFNKIYKNDEAIALLQMIDKVDAQIKKKSFNKNELPKQFLNFEIQFPSGNQINFDAPLGRELFKDGDLDKLLQVSSQDLNVPHLNEDDKRIFSNALEKEKNGQYKTKVNPKAFERMFDNGLNGLAKTAESIGDENINAFVKGFANAYGFDRNLSQDSLFTKTNENNKNQTKEKPKEQTDVSYKISDKEKEIIKQDALKSYSVNVKTKPDKDKEISKPTTIGKSL